MTRTAVLAAVLVSQSLITSARAVPPETVEPSELSRRAELANREILVDDRIRYFLESKRGKGYDELLFKRTDVLFRLAPRLRYTRAPSEPNARIRGILKVEEGRWTCEVTAIELFSADLERLDGEIARLRADDYQGRRAWGLWAERRGKELNDSKLATRGEVLEGEALSMEAERPGADALALATQSVSRPIPAGVRNGLAHRGFRALLAKAATVAELDDLAHRIAALLPASSDPKAAATSVADQIDAYRRDPASTYREADEPIRMSLDRRLLADTIQKSLEKQVEERPGDASILADSAVASLPDRPELAERLRQRGMGEAETRVASMLQSEVEDLARRFREQKQEDRARRLLLTWLNDRRKNRLSTTDSEGRVLLANSYEKLLGDKAAAADLLREALALDPTSRAASDAFLRMGFRKDETGWFDPDSRRSEASSQPASDRTDSGSSLRGLTRSQVRSRLGGKPDLVIRSATQGRCVEQWVYQNGKLKQIVNFSIEPGTSEPRAASYYSEKK